MYIQSSVLIRAWEFKPFYEKKNSYDDDGPTNGPTDEQEGS